MADEVAMTRLNSGEDYAVTIPDGYAAGDIVVIRLLGKVFVEADVLEGLVRAWHERRRAGCSCGWTRNMGPALTWGRHVDHEVREALAGRAKL